MSKPKHTPGPWSIQEKENQYILGVHLKPKPRGELQPDGRAVALIPKLKFRPEQKANAQLIAAAPEMLETLELFAVYCSGQKTIKAELAMVLHQALEAIKKARGEL